MMLFDNYLLLLAICCVWMIIWHAISVIKKDASIIDIAWGYGLALASAIFLVRQGSETSLPQLLTSLLIFIWGTRLGIHIMIRKIGKPEDWRYQAMRNKHGKRFAFVSLYRIFLLQALLLSLVGLPLVISFSSGSEANIGLLVGGIFVWSVGFIFEALGDYQLSRFLKQKQKPPIMKTGLWRYTRHPNYFGEITMWWGIFLMTVSLGNGLLGIISPVLISFLLLKVSGITMLEKKYEDNQYYQQYKKETSAIVPLPPNL